MSFLGKVKQVAKSYTFYFLSTLAKLALFYFVVRYYSKETFIAYNLYLFYTDISVSIVNAGTKAALRHRLAGGEILGSAIYFENLFYIFISVLLFAIGTIFPSLVNEHVNYGLLFLIGIFRLNVQLLSRYFLVFETLKKSIIIDMLANFMWIPVVLAIGFIFRPQSVQFIFYVWLCFLGVVAFFYLFKYRAHLKLLEPFQKLKSFGQIYLSSFQFSLASQIYGNTEKLIFTKRFTEVSLVSSYLVSAKVIGLAAELTSGFIGSFLENNLKKVDRHEAEGRGFALVWKALFVNFLLFVAFAIGLLIVKPLVLYLLGNQLVEENYDILFLILPVYMFSNFYNILMILLHRKGFLRVPNLIGLFQFIVLAIQFLIPMSANRFIVLQIILFFIAFIAAALSLLRAQERAENLPPSPSTN